MWKPVGQRSTKSIAAGSLLLRTGKWLPHAPYFCSVVTVSLFRIVIQYIDCTPLNERCRTEEAKKNRILWQHFHFLRHIWQIKIAIIPIQISFDCTFFRFFLLFFLCVARPYSFRSCFYASWCHITKHFWTRTFY